MGGDPLLEVLFYGKLPFITVPLYGMRSFMGEGVLLYKACPIAQEVSSLWKVPPLWEVNLYREWHSL